MMIYTDYEKIVSILSEMSHNELNNYIIPGLSSSLISGEGYGKIRLFKAVREMHYFVTPHSHRWNFAALVLKGKVRNSLYLKSSDIDEQADAYCLSTIGQVCGADGLNNYIHARENVPSYWKRITHEYKAGETYSMEYSQIHSISFEKGTEVLFFESPEKTHIGYMLEPWVNGKVIPTFKTEDWMFEKNK